MCGSHQKHFSRSSTTSLELEKTLPDSAELTEEAVELKPVYNGTLKAKANQVESTSFRFLKTDTIELCNDSLLMDCVAHLSP